MHEAILLILGGFMGLVVFHIPSSRWLEKDQQLSKEAFRAAFPEKISVYYLYKLLPLAWLGIYPAIIFPGVLRLFENSSLILYFVGYLLIGGFGILDGLVELATGVSPIRHEAGVRSSLRLRYLVVNDSVPAVGLLRVLLTIGVGLLSWIIIPLII